MRTISFQEEVVDWAYACFGPEIVENEMERCDRVLEEVLELLQSLGYPSDRVRQLLNYVYDRPAGEPDQELGGTMVTLAALCGTFGLDMEAAGNRELARIWNPDVIAKIRAKNAAKPEEVRSH